MPTYIADVPKVRNEVEAEDISKAEVVNRHADGQSPDDNATVGENDLSIVVGRENDRVGVEVCESTMSKESLVRRVCETYGLFPWGNASGLTR